MPPFAKELQRNPTGGPGPHAKRQVAPSRWAGTPGPVDHFHLRKWSKKLVQEKWSKRSTHVAVRWAGGPRRRVGAGGAGGARVMNGRPLPRCRWLATVMFSRARGRGGYTFGGGGLDFSRQREADKSKAGGP